MINILGNRVLFCGKGGSGKRTVIYDPDLPKRHLQGDLSLSKALYNDIEMVIRRLEVFSSCVEHGWDDL
jgi:hypothetical protein